jgi:hypothetical protein
MTKVFISYRRETASGEARALYNELTTRLDKESVVMDVDSFALGRDFRKQLQRVLESCDIMLVLIDKHWIDATNEEGKRRLDDDSDFVRQEVEAALGRDIVVTPTLLGGAKLPSVEMLPAKIKDLAFRGAFEISHNRWDSDVKEMLRRLDLVIGDRRDAATPSNERAGHNNQVDGSAPSASSSSAPVPTTTVTRQNDDERGRLGRADDTAQATSAANQIQTLIAEQKLNTVWDTLVSKFFKDRFGKSVFIANLSQGQVAMGGRPLSQQFVDVTYSSFDPQSGYKGDIYACRYLTKYPVGSFYQSVVVIKEPDGQYRLSGLFAAPAPTD